MNRTEQSINKDRQNKKAFRFTCFLFILLLVLSLAAGCGSDSTSTPTETKTITDCVGRTVEIPEDPQRVACMYASTAHMMAMLDEGDKIVGAPNGVKSDVLMQMKYPQITETATPYQEGTINVEELLRIDADLVLVRYSTAENEGETEKLDELGIPYVVIDYLSIEELEQAITVMGQVFGKEEQAKDYLGFMDDTMDMVSRRIGDVPRDQWPQVYHSVNEAIRTDGEGDICGEIMNLAYVNDMSIEQGVGSGGDKTYTTLEEIYNWDPDAFIANESSVTEYILSDSKWVGLTAVKSRAVYTLPVGATRWCHPGSMEAHMGVLAVARQFYPEAFADFDLDTYVKDYYEQYFGLTIDDQTVSQILSGEGMRVSNSPID